MNRLTLPSLPLADWPTDLAERWTARAAVQGWSHAYTSRIARAVGLWLAFAGPAPPACATMTAFRHRLERDLAPPSAASYCRDLAYGAPLVWPNADWTWLKSSIAALQAPRVRVAPRERPPRQRLILPVPDWPAEWRDRWHAALQPTRRRTGRSACVRWSTAYRARIERGVGRYLKWLNGREPVIDGDHVGAYVTALEGAGLGSVSIAMHVGELAAWCRSVLHCRDIARFLQDLADDYAADGTGARKLGRIAPLADVERLARRLIRQAQAMPATSRAATTARDGAMIAVLARRPIRLRNFATLRLGKELTLEGTDGTLMLSDTKTGDPYVVPLPKSVVALLRIYVETYRPLLVGDSETEKLWIGRDGRPMLPSSISRHIGTVTERGLGRNITPHLFRDVLATEAYKVGPDAAHLSGAALGHRGDATRERHYQHGQSTAAAAALHAVVKTTRRARAPHRRNM